MAFLIFDGCMKEARGLLVAYETRRDEQFDVTVLLIGSYSL